MKIFKKFKFLNRFSKIPRDIFSHSKELNLSSRDLDVIFKIQNFIIGKNDIIPNLTKIAERSWTSIRTFQRSLNDLKERWYLEVLKRKDEVGKFTTNSYKIDWLFSKLDILNNQTYMDFDNECIFWTESSGLDNCSFVLVPKTLDFFQKKLNISINENLFLKYLLWYIDDNWVSEISLNYTTKTTPLTRKTLQRCVKSLEEKWLIVIKEQFHWKTKIRRRNRYDLKPLLEELNELERARVEEKLKEKWKWKDYSKSRTHNLSELSSTSTEGKEENSFNNKERILFLKNEIFRLQSNLTSKYSETADTIRQYQQEINELEHNSIKSGLISHLMQKRLDVLSNSWDKHSEFGYRAKILCDKLNWNWNKSFNLYIKAVKKLPWTVDRFVWLALEKAKNREKYFAKCVSKEFRKLELTI